VLTSAGRSAVCGVRLEMRRGAQRVAVTVLDEAAGLTATALGALDVGAGDRLDATR
jgi:ferric-dicitrate binding protein FerR (iron transport regulator)